MRGPISLSEKGFNLCQHYKPNIWPSCWVFFGPSAMSGTRILAQILLSVLSSSESSRLQGSLPLGSLSWCSQLASLTIARTEFSEHPSAHTHQFTSIQIPAFNVKWFRYNWATRLWSFTRFNIMGTHMIMQHDSSPLQPFSWIVSFLKFSCSCPNPHISECALIWKEDHYRWNSLTWCHEGGPWSSITVSLWKGRIWTQRLTGRTPCVRGDKDWADVFKRQGTQRLPVDLQKHMVPPRPQKEPTAHFLNSDAEPPDRETTDLVVLRRSACGALLTAAQASQPGSRDLPSWLGRSIMAPSEQMQAEGCSGKHGPSDSQPLALQETIILSELPFCSSKKLTFSTFLARVAMKG